MGGRCDTAIRGILVYTKNPNLKLKKKIWVGGWGEVSGWRGGGGGLE